MKNERTLRGVMVLVGVLPCLIGNANSAGELTDAEFRRLHAELQPGEDEPWRSIPWKTVLLDAQQVAAKQRKPVFIWAMDGHPLGCT